MSMSETLLNLACLAITHVPCAEYNSRFFTLIFLVIVAVSAVIYLLWWWVIPYLVPQASMRNLLVWPALIGEALLLDLYLWKETLELGMFVLLTLCWVCPIAYVAFFRGGRDKRSKKGR